MYRTFDRNGAQTHNYLVRKRTFNHLAKLAIWPTQRTRPVWLNG